MILAVKFSGDVTRNLNPDSRSYYIYVSLPLPRLLAYIYLTLSLVFRIIYHLVFCFVFYLVFCFLLCFVFYLVFRIVCCLPGKVYIPPLLARIKKCASLTELHQ